MSELPFYQMPFSKRYPAVSRPGYEFEGTVNFAQLREDKRTKLGYAWVTHERQPCCFTLRHGHAVAFALNPHPFVLNSEKIASFRWFNFVTGKDSPWRKVLKDVEVVYEYDGVPYSVIVKDCRVSRAMLHNFFLALRCPWEHSFFVGMFSKMIDKGVPPQAAMFYAWNLVIQNGQVSTARHNSHTFMDTAWRNPPLMSRFYDVPDLVIPKELFTAPAADGGFIRSNHIWHLYASDIGDARSLPLPPVLADFPSASATQMPGPFTIGIVSIYKMDVDKFYDEVVDAWQLRLEREKEVLVKGI